MEMSVFVFSSKVQLYVAIDHWNIVSMTGNWIFIFLYFCFLLINLTLNSHMQLTAIILAIQLQSKDLLP